MKNEVIKELLTIDPNALKGLNKVFHFDYNKEFKAVLITGNTTINQIQKKIDAGSNDLIIVLNYRCGRVWFNKLQTAIIEYSGNSVLIDFQPHYFSGSNILGAYHSIGDFREHLKIKDDDVMHFVIAQNKDFLSVPEKHHIDESNRFKINITKQGAQDIRRCSYKYGSESYISEIGLIDRQSNGIPFTFRPNIYLVGKDIKEVDEIIDKSGYLVCNYRNELYRKAKMLKADREKAAYLAVDNSAKVDELRLRIKAKKLELIELLKQADTSEQLEIVAKSLESWRNGFTSIVSSFEDMEKAINEKRYDSIESFERNYNAISNKLLNCGKD